VIDDELVKGEVEQLLRGLTADSGKYMSTLDVGRE
jgi:hypothetical protein